MKINKVFFFFLITMPLLYTSSYCVLRLAKYFVRQEFITFGCSKEIQAKYPSYAGSVEEGYISYQCESHINQIGCGCIQKSETSFDETILLPMFWPLAEFEMYTRGFGTSTIYVYKTVLEFERYDSDKNKVYFPRTSVVQALSINRNNIIF